MQFPEAETIEDNLIAPTDKVRRFRDWFKAAVDKSSDWRDEGQEDFDFVAGKQWRDEDKRALDQQGRPSITINKIKPLINVLSGYQRLNRYDIDFQPRGSDDQPLCEVRKGVTKYIMDRCDYEYHESQAFTDGAICGLGWLEVRYKWDQELGDGEAEIVREDPFAIYVDPESRKPDFSDAKYIIRAKWVDKEELKLVFPEHADEIDRQQRIYDVDEDKDEYMGVEPLWYKKKQQKLRLVECWYKTKEKETFYTLNNGQQITKADVSVDLFLNGMVESARTVPVNKVKVCSFFDNVELEDIDSPYKHGEFPFVPFVAYNYAEGDMPAGIVRDLKDPQREINKRRSQTLHILNTTSNSGWLVEDGALTPDQERQLRMNGAKPGMIQHVPPNALSGGKIRRLEPVNPPVALMEAEQQAQQDLPAISGINEALMGTDVASSASGRAIQLKQKQAITHIAPLFDNLRRAKKRIAYLLWGRRGHPGIIPQYYTEPKVYRIEGKNGFEFMPVNQPVQQVDPLHGVIQTTLNDLSQGEFDIVIADTNASTTQREAQMWGLVDAVSKLGVPGDMVFDIILELSDLPQKEEIKKRWQEKQQGQSQQAQAQQQLELAKLNRINNTISFKDAPLPIQMAMAAKDGLVDPNFAKYLMDQMIHTQYPQFAQEMDKQQFLAEQQQKQLPQGGQGPPPQAQQPQSNQGQGQPPKTTQAAIESYINGQGAAM